MCYSAMVKQRLKKLGLEFKARVQIDMFEDVYKRRAIGQRIKLPRAMDFNFLDESDKSSIAIKSFIDEYNAQAIRLIEEDTFAQKKRLADAERKLKEKPTKTAEKEKGIAERKLEANKRRLEKLRSRSERPEDSRIYAMDFAPVLVWENGERVIKPMRYLCRPAGFDEDFDRQYPGCYNARRDSLKKFWKNQYRRNHAILIISSFFENVKGPKGENVVMQFQPDGFDRMIIPCIWDLWSAKNQADLYSFALITDEPPKEVSDAGHDRCPIFIKEKNIEKWLRPDLTSEVELEAVLDDKEKPFYRHTQVA